MSDSKARKKTSTKTPSPARSPLDAVRGFFNTKPKLVVKRGEEARIAKQEAAARPIDLWALTIRLLPVWALLLMVLILEPALPFRAVGAVINWGLGLLPERASQDSVEPVFIVEAPDEGPVADELPPPNWPLEIAPIFTSEVQYWEERIGQWSLAYRIKPNMIATLMQIESCGNPQAVSGAGAEGLFQVMPPHFEDGESRTDPDTNAGRGLIYFGEMLASANGDPGKAFAAYNGGPSMVFVSPADWPSETQDYQFWAGGIFEEAELGLASSPTLSDWLDAGGYSLCAQAAQVLGLAAQP